MAQVCSKCSNVNPVEAVYCFYDGMLLSTGNGSGGPVNAGAAPFPTPFVFPTGQTCQNFDQLALTCEQNWLAATDVLKQGFLVGFFGGLGRADLAISAKEAAAHPDIHRGLDQLLAKLPTQVLESPKLKVEPSSVNLGVVPMGTDRHFDITLINQGMRLLYGTIASDSKWMTVGEAPGQDQKLFQFTDETTIRVQINGSALRAGPKPLAGELIVQYNGEQQAVIAVQLEVPVKPFQQGVLAGATTPRQIAEKAKVTPKEAAALFESGAVSQWFKDNGWIYPVQGPSASGLSAVQQFFEALGLVKPPTVLIDKLQIVWAGDPGQTLQTTLEVKTNEKRPVYAHGSSDQPWLDVSKTNFQGRTATINVVARIPNRPGEMLNAKIRVAANGNQRFDIPVKIQVSGEAPIFMIDDEPPQAEALNPFPDELQVATETAVPAIPVENVGMVPTDLPVDDGDPFANFALGSQQNVTTAQPAAGVIPRNQKYARYKATGGIPFWMHLLPAGILLLCLLGIVMKDLLVAPTGRPNAGGEGIAATPRILIDYDYAPWYKGEKGKGLSQSMRFGIRASSAPGKLPSANDSLRLTYDIHGQNNQTSIRIDGKVMKFGDTVLGFWDQKPQKISNKALPSLIDTKAVWDSQQGIQVTQKVSYIPGEPIIAEGNYQRYMDSCVVIYEIKNTSNRKRQVGMRFLLDTLIGSNDGVPFLLPGSNNLVDSFIDFKSRSEVPDFIQAYEAPNLREPGIVAQVTFALSNEIEPPSRVSLTRWPGGKKIDEYEVPLASLSGTAKNNSGDSAVVMYWEDKELEPNATRTIGFGYGLGYLASNSGKLALTIGGNLSSGGELTVVGLVNEPEFNETLTLKLPEGFSIVGNEKLTRSVPEATMANRPSPVAWKLRAGAPGDYTIVIESSTGERQERQIKIKSKTIFN